LVDALAVFGCGDDELLAGSDERRSGGDWLQGSGGKWKGVRTGYTNNDS
jgi:hypothetical protein